jgi:hypothetical protein
MSRASSVCTLRDGPEAGHEPKRDETGRDTKGRESETEREMERERRGRGERGIERERERERSGIVGGG